MGNEPVWLPVARKYLGTTEIPGKSHNPVIQRWLRDLRGWWSDDETPWCGTFVATVLRESNLAIPKHWYRAKAYLNYGTMLPGASLGAIVVFDRKGGGHVGFAVGRDRSGRLMVLGGNQGNAVNVRPFDAARIAGFRWPVHPNGTPAVNPHLELPAFNVGPTPSSRDEA